MQFFECDICALVIAAATDCSTTKIRESLDVSTFRTVVYCNKAH